MSTPENTFIASLHRRLPALGELYREKMANPYRGGTADVWYSAKRDLWVEYKFIVVPKRPDTIIDLIGGKKPMLSALQQEWLNSRFDEGRNVWVIVGCKEGGVVFCGKSWMKPITTREFRDELRTRDEIAKELVAFLTVK